MISTVSILLKVLAMWLWIGKISWADNIRNEEVWELSRKRKKSLIEHVSRAKGLLKDVIDGRWKEMESEEDKNRKVGLINGIINFM